MNRPFYYTKMITLIVLIDAILINVGFVLAFLIRYSCTALGFLDTGL